MTKIFKTAVICASSLTALAISASAGFAQDTLEIRNFIGTVNWSNGDMSVNIRKPGETTVSKGGTMIIDGGQTDIDGSGCESAYGNFKVNWFGKKKEGSFGGYKDLEDFPVLDISVPAATKLILRDSIVFTDGAPDLAEADVAMRHCGKLSLGDIDGMLALDNRGSADVTAGSTGQLVAYLKGSGDLTAGDSGEVLIDSRGSADVELGNIASLEAGLNGSGDVSAGNIDGDAELSSKGSGDIRAGAVTGSLSYKSTGSGGLEAVSVTGDKLTTESFGSGDIDIGGGQVGELRAALRGSGDIDFAGEAVTAELSSLGSGDISVDRVTGAVEKTSRGSGEIDIDTRG